MTGLEFLRADPAHMAWCSPLDRALARAPAGIRDVSSLAEDGLLGRASGIAGIEIEAPWVRTLIARLTDLEPAGIGAVAGMRAQITIEEPDRYRIWVAREYADSMAEAVIDAWVGLA